LNSSQMPEKRIHSKTYECKKPVHHRTDFYF
jgi:hypothetical protein